MNFDTASALLIVLVFVVWAIRTSGRAPRPFHIRHCQGRGWYKAFPASSKDEIRAFLQLFVASFAFNDNQKLKFNPDDKVLDVYRALHSNKYLNKLLADAMELETFQEDLFAKYALNLEDYWHDGITLGEVFALADNSRSSINEPQQSK